MTFGSDFFHSKTNTATLATILTTIAGALNHQITPFHAALVILGLMHIPFLRDTWVKSVEQFLGTVENMAFGDKADGGEVPAGPAAP